METTVESSLRQAMNRLGNVIAEGKSLLNDKNILYDNIAGFDSIIEAIKAAPNFKSGLKQNKASWIKPNFIRDGVEIVDNALLNITEIVPCGYNFYAISKPTGNIYYSTYTPDGVLEFSKKCTMDDIKNYTEGTLIALPYGTKTTFANRHVFIYAAGSYIRVVDVALLGESGGIIASVECPDTVVGINLIGADMDGDLVISAYTTSNYYQLRLQFDTDNGLYTFTTDLDSFMDTVIHDSIISESVESEKESYYLFNNVEYIVSDLGLRYINRSIGANDDNPLGVSKTVSDIAATSLIKMKDKIIAYSEITAENDKVVCCDKDVTWSQTVIVEEGYTIKWMQAVSSNVIIGIMNKTDSNKNILFAVRGIGGAAPITITTKNNAIDEYIPGGISDKYGCNRSMIWCISGDGSLYVKDVADSFISPTRLIDGLFYRDAISCNRIYGMNGSTLTGYVWRETATSNGLKRYTFDYEREKIHQSNTGFVYGNGIAVIYNPGHLSDGCIVSRDGSTWDVESMPEGYDNLIHNGVEFVCFGEVVNNEFTYLRSTNLIKFTSHQIDLTPLQEGIGDILSSIKNIIKVNDIVIILGNNDSTEYIKYVEMRHDMSLTLINVGLNHHFESITEISMDKTNDNSFMLTALGTDGVTSILEAKFITDYIGSGFNGVATDSRFIELDTKLNAGETMRLHNNGETIIVAIYDESNLLAYTVLEEKMMDIIRRRNINGHLIPRSSFVDVTAGPFSMYNENHPYKSISIIRSAFIMWNDIDPLISYDGLVWDRISDSTFFLNKAIDPESIYAGNINGAGICITKNTDDGTINIMTSGDIKRLTNGGYFEYTSFLNTANRFNFTFDFAPKYVALMIVDKSGNYNSILFSSDGFYINDEGKNVHIATFNILYDSCKFDYTMNRFELVSEYIVLGNKFTIIAF